MTSRKNKSEILSLSRGKNKKHAKVNERKDQHCVPTAEYGAESQNCIIKNKKADKKLIVSFNSHRTIRKRKSNEDGSSKKTKKMRTTSESKIIQESGVITSSSLFDDKVSDSDLIVVSETESYASEKISSFDDYQETVRNCNLSELCDEKVLSVSDNKLHPSYFYAKSPSPVPSIPLLSKYSMPVISGGSNLCIKEDNKHTSYHSTFSAVDVLPEIEINTDVDFSCSTDSEKIYTVVDSANSSTNSNICPQNTSTDYDNQCLAKNFVDLKNMDPKSHDILTLLLNRLNEAKNCKENFICNQLKIEPIIKPEEYDYEHNCPFKIALDFSVLKAANDYIKENSSKYDNFPAIPSDVNLENLWHSSSIKSSDLTLASVNFISSDSNQLNSEDAESEISITSCNTADIQPDFFDIDYSESPKKGVEEISNDLENCSWENLNNAVNNFIHSQDLDVDSEETSNKQMQNLLCKSADLLNEVNVEESIKLCAKVKRRRKKTNWNPKKRKCRKRNGTMSKVNGLLDEILCDTCDENELDEYSYLVPTEEYELSPLNSSCLSTSSCLEKKSVTKIIKNKTLMVENSNSGKPNSFKGRSKQTTQSTMKSESKENGKSIKDNPDIISQIPAEEALLSDIGKEGEQFSKCDQAEQCMSEISDSIETDSNSKISCGNSGSVLSGDDVYKCNQNTKNLDLSCKRVENCSLEIGEQNSKTGCNLSLDEEQNAIKLKLTSEGKEIRLLEGLVVGLERLNELTLKKYCRVSNGQGKGDRSSDPSTENGSSNNADSQPSCSNSEETQVQFSCLQQDVQLCASEQVDQKENHNLKEKLNISKKTKHPQACRSKSEENSLSKDSEISQHLKKGVKATIKTKITSEKLDSGPCEKDKKHLDVLVSEREENSRCEVSKVSNHLEKTDSSETKVSSPCKELNIVLEQKLYDKTLKLKNKEKDIADSSKSSKPTEKHLKAVDLFNTGMILPGECSNGISDKQCISVFNSKRGEKVTSDLALNRHPKKHLKTVDSGNTNKKITLRGKESKVSPKHKQDVFGLKFETKKNGCSEDSGLNKHSEKRLKNSNSPKTKISSAGEQSNVSLKEKQSISSLKSKHDVNFTSDVLGSVKHPTNHLKNSDLSERTVTTIGGKTDVSSEQKTHGSDDCSASEGVNQNKNCKNNINSVKKSKVEVTILSSKSIDFQNKVKISRELANESSKPMPHLTTSSDTSRRESKSSKAKEDGKRNEEEQNKLKKSAKKLNSKITPSKNSDSNPCSQNLSNKNSDMVNITVPVNSNYQLSDESTFSEIVRSMKPIPKLSHRKKIEKSVSHSHQGEESKKDSSPLVKLVVDNSANVQSSPTQTFDFENNACDISSLKHDDTSETVILTEDDYLDFELDQSEDLTVKHSVCNNVTESSDAITGQVNNKIPASVQKEVTLNSSGTPESDAIYSGSNLLLKDSVTTEQHDSTLQASKGTYSKYPYNDLIYSRTFFTPPGKDWLSEDDSDSDDEHSFKRTRYERKENDIEETSVNSVNLNNCEENSAMQIEIHQYESEPVGPNEVCHSSISPVSSFTKSESFKSSCEDQDIDSSKGEQTDCLKSKISTGSVAHLNDVLAQIKDLCSKELFNEAVEVTKTYFAISSSDINKRILQELLFSIFAFIFKSDKDNNSTFKILDDVLQLIRHYNIYNQQIASYFITKCCSHSDLNIYSIKLFHICHKGNISLDREALKAFSLILNSGEISLDLILDFVNYVKVVCHKKISKELVHLSLKRCETLSFSDIHHTCSLLHSITPKEVDEQNLKGFILLCFEKGMWQHVAEMFIAWGSRNSLSISIYSALTVDFETMGRYFKKWANYVHEKEGSLRPELKDRLTPELKARFGQMGTALMLAAFSRSYMGTALDVLCTLHAYNVNYFELQHETGRSPSTQSSSEIENYSIKVFPFSVVFIAIDICLYHNRPKDAFTIFQEFSWVMPDQSLDDAVRTYAIKERYQRLLKLVPLLNSQDSLNEGWETLENLLTTVKQDLTDEMVQENIEDLVSIYNKYLVSLLNSEKISTACILYQYSLGPKKDIFTIFPDVLRGLVVAFSEDGRDKAANSLFLLGVMRKIYPIQKPNLENFPWEITLMTHWTLTEIKVAVEWFIGVLFPLLMEKPKETNFEKWFSVKIVFDITPQSTLDIECLKETVSDSKYHITKTRDALQTMNPSLEVTEIINENALCITSDSLYNFWKSRCPDAAFKFNCMDLQFVKLSDEKFYFGNDGNCSTERESSVFVSKFFSETSALRKSPKTIRDPQSSVKSLQSLSRQEWGKSSASDVCEMIDEIKANVSPLSYIASTPERSPRGTNVMHDIPSSGRYWLSENDIVHGNEQIREFQHQGQHLSNVLTQTISPNRLTSVHDKSVNQILKSQQIAVSDVNQSQNKSENLTNSSPLTVNSRSLPLFPPENDFKPVRSKTSNSPSNSNKSPITDSCLNTAQSDTKNNDLLPKNRAENQGKFSPRGLSLNSVHSPLVGSEDMNNLLNSVQTTSLNKRKKRRKINDNKKLIALNSVKSNGKFTCLSSSMTVSQPTVNDNSAVPVKQSLSESNTISVNQTPASIKKLRAAKEKKLKVIPSSKKFKNFTVCVTPSDRTVNSPINQSLPVFSETNQNNIRKNETCLINTEKKPCQTFPVEVPVSNSSSVVPKTIQNDAKRIVTSFATIEAEPSSSLSCKVSNSKVTLVRLPVSKVQEHKQELNNHDISFQTSESSIHSVDSLSKGKCTKTISLKTMTNVKSNNIAINAPFKDCNKDQHKTKPVIKRNFSTSVNKNIVSMASKDKMVNRITSAPGSGASVISLDRSENVADVNQNLKVNRVFKESSESFMPVSGSSSCSDEDFKKIIQFLKVKVTLKNKTLSPEEQNKRALSLAQTFIRNNKTTTGLDKRAMKLLTEFANHNV